MANPIVEKAKERMTQSHQSLGREFGSIRAGRANASLLDRIFVEYYGVETPLNQIGIYHHSRSACLVDHSI